MKTIAVCGCWTCNRQRHLQLSPCVRAHAATSAPEWLACLLCRMLSRPASALCRTLLRSQARRRWQAQPASTLSLTARFVALLVLPMVQGPAAAASRPCCACWSASTTARRGRVGRRRRVLLAACCLLLYHCCWLLLLVPPVRLPATCRVRRRRLGCRRRCFCGPQWG